MTGRQLRQARHARGWTQADAAKRLGVSRSYVSLLESDSRAVPAHRILILRSVFRLRVTALPIEATLQPFSSDSAAKALGALGYPGFAHLAAKHVLDPTELLIRTLLRRSVEARVVEALPWLMVRFRLDWKWLVSYAKHHGLQNRLGFVVTLSQELARRRDDAATARLLTKWGRILEISLIQNEDSFAGEASTEAERAWLRANRSAVAARWNLLSNVSAETLPEFLD